jgi:phage terminase small subunit
MTDLNLKQSRFVEEFVSNGGNATAAYKAAGYRWKSENGAGAGAAQVLQSRKVQDAITKLIAKTKVDHEWITERLVKEATREDEKANHSARVRATELIGKHKQYFPPEEKNVRVAQTTFRMDYETARRPEVQQAAREFIKYVNPDLYAFITTPSVLDSTPKMIDIAVEPKRDLLPSPISDPLRTIKE